MEVLSENKYVEKVSQASVSFTIEFKQEFYGLLLEGFGPSQAILLLGIDPHILGKQRVSELIRRTRRQASRPEGFSRIKGSGRPKAMTFDSPEEELKYLKDQLAYLKQENKFLKKLEALENKYR